MRSSTKLDGTDGTNNGVYCKWLAGVGWALPDRMGSERIEGVVGRAGPDQTGPDWAGPDQTGPDWPDRPVGPDPGIKTAHGINVRFGLCLGWISGLIF